MNKLVPATLFAVCLCAGVPHAEEAEALRDALASGINGAALQAAENLSLWRSRRMSPRINAAPKASEPILQFPDILEMDNIEPMGSLLGSFALADCLDAHADLFTLELGDKSYDLSLASDPGFDKQYFAFRREGRILLHKIENANELRKKGIVVRLDGSTAYKFKVSVNIFSPTRGSTLNITPERGTRGPSHKIKTGDILDAIERKSFRFRTGGKEFWLLYGTDADPATGALADTRSFLFIHEDGLSSKAWPVPEKRLNPGKALLIDLGDTKISLVKTPEGRLRIYEGVKNAALASAR